MEGIELISNGAEYICPFCKIEITIFEEINEYLYLWCKNCYEMVAKLNENEINGKMMFIKKIKCVPFKYYFSDDPVDLDIIVDILRNNNTYLATTDEYIYINGVKIYINTNKRINSVGDFNVALDCNSYKLMFPEFPYPDEFTVNNELDIPVLLENDLITTYCGN